MSRTIRAFVAIELPEAVTAALGELVGALSAADVRGVRLVRPQGIHLTLKFLGNISDGLVGDIVGTASEAAESSAPFNLELGEVGAFPSVNRPRVLWVGMSGGVGPVLALQECIAESLVPLGFDRESRPFSPHLTVARIRDGTSISDRRLAAEVLLAAPFRTGLRIPVESISLMRSILHPGGAIYERLASVRLGPPPVPHVP